jgi:hypothetical protein
MTTVSSRAVTQITVWSNRRAGTETERRSAGKRGVTLHDFSSDCVWREESSGRQASASSVLWMSCTARCLKMMQTAPSSRSRANGPEGCLAALILRVGYKFES